MILLVNNVNLGKHPGSGKGEHRYFGGYNITDIVLWQYLEKISYKSTKIYYIFMHLLGFCVLFFCHVWGSAASFSNHS